MHLYIWEEGEISEFFSEINLYFTLHIFQSGHDCKIFSSCKQHYNLFVFFFSISQIINNMDFFSNKRYKKS